MPALGLEPARRAVEHTHALQAQVDDLTGEELQLPAAVRHGDRRTPLAPPPNTPNAASALSASSVAFFFFVNTK